MKKRLISLLLLAVLVAAMLAACGPDVVTAEEAQAIALEAMGLDASDADDVHTHVVTYRNQACYSIHITVDGTGYEYIIAGKTGEILSPAAE